MQDELIESYVDRAKFHSDTVFIENEFTALKKMQDELASFRYKFANASNPKATSEAAEEGIKANARLTESIKAVNSVITQRFAAESKLATLQTDYTKQTAAARVEIQKQAAETKALAQAEAATIGSRDRATAQIKALTIQKNKLNLLNEDEKKQYDVLVAKIEKYNTFLVKTGTSREKQAANVGNYQGSAKIITDALEKEIAKLKELEAQKIRVQNAGASPITGFAGNRSSNVQGSAAELEKINAQIQQSRTIVEGFSRVTEQPQFLNIAGKVGDANKELRFFTKALIDMERAGQGNSKAAIELRKHLAQLTDQVSDAKAEIKALSSDTRDFDLFAGSVSFAADAFQTFAGAAVLAGASEQDAAEATKTLVAVQSVANGVKGIANELTTRGTAANKLYSFAQTQVSLAMDGTATAGVRLRAILATLGFGAVIIGIGLLIANFSKIKDAVTGATVSTKAYSETLADYKKGAAEAIEKTQKVGAAFQEAKQGVISKDAALNIYNDTLGDTFGKATSLAEAERLYNEKAGVYIQVMGLKAQANALFAKSAEEAAKGITAANEDQVSTFEKLKIGAKAAFFGMSGDTYRELSEAQKSGVEKFTATTKQNAADLNAEAVKLATEADSLIKSAGLNFAETKTGDTKKGTASKKVAQAKDDNAAIKAIAIENANELIRINQKVIDSENASLPEKLAAIEAVSEQKKKIAAIESIGDKQTANEKLLAKKVLENKINAINDESLQLQFKAQKENTDKVIAEYNRLDAEKLAQLESSTQAARDRNDKDYSDAVIALNKQFNAGLISQKEYNKERLRLDNQYKIDSLKIEIAHQKALIELSALPLNEKAAALRKLAELEKELSDAGVKNVEANENKKLAAIRKTLDKASEGYAIFKDALGGVLDGATDREKNRIADEMTAIDKRKEAELRANDARVQSDQDRAANAQLIESRAAAQREQLERRQRELDQQKAKRDKALTIFGLTLELFKAIATFNPWKIAAATGALIKAIATPIPRFFKGKAKGQAYSGPAMVNDHPDGVTTEVIERADGTIEMPSGRNVITDIGANDIIHPNKDVWMKEITNAAHRDMARGISGGISQANYMEQMTKQLGRQFDKQSNLLKQIVEKKAANVVVFGNEHNIYTNNNCNF